jgi:hypothetical protein
MSADTELDSLSRDLNALVQHRLEDIRADVRAALARSAGMVNHPVLTVGDCAALIEIKRILADAEKRLENLQMERGKRY